MSHSLLGPVLLAALVACSSTGVTPPSDSSTRSAADASPLGAFSVSLSVKDLAASRTFYEQLGFTVVGGDARGNWLILRSGTTTIGLFHGMFQGNLLTFNPGWSQLAEPLPRFEDIRSLQRRIEQQGVKLTTRADDGTKGPASFTLVDPDGNVILVDQHVQ